MPRDNSVLSQLDEFDRKIKSRWLTMYGTEVIRARSTKMTEIRDRYDNSQYLYVLYCSEQWLSYVVAMRLDKK